MTDGYQQSRAAIGQNIWDLETLLPKTYQLPEHYVTAAPAGVLINFCALLSRDVFSEGDAQSLYDHIAMRRGEISPEFLRLLRHWLADELKHYEALRRVYHVLAGVSFVQMDQVFAARVHEIEPIAPVLVDEFTLLVTLIFDEIGSVYSYRRDLWEYYQHFGPQIRRVGLHLVQDEGMHFHNAATVLLANHRDRLGEVKALLAQIVGLENQLGRYCKTFLLDHAQEQFRFPPQFNGLMVQMVLAKLGLGDRPSAAALQAIWHWTPQPIEFSEKEGGRPATRASHPLFRRCPMI